ncbi:DMT family transporter [Bordetella tumulicola]
MSGRLSGTEASALQIIWLRYVGGFATMVVALLVRRDIVGILSTTQPFLHACRAAAGGFGGVAAVFVAGNMPVASASAIGLLDGLFTVLLGLIVLREYVPLRQWLATIASLAGAMTVVGAQGAFSNWDVEYTGPALIALAGAMLIAIESIMIKTLVRTEAALTVLFYVNLFGSMILAWLGISSWQTIPFQWLFAFLMLGPVAILAQCCNINAFRQANASVVGPIRYAWIIYGSVFGALFFDESITLPMGIGVCLVLFGGGCLAFLRNRPRL